MFKKILATELIKMIVGSLFTATPPAPTGLVVFGGTKEEFHKEMEPLSDTSITDSAERVTMYLHKGTVVGVMHRWPKGNYCYMVECVS